jgi:predicted nucleic acid-binding protein
VSSYFLESTAFIKLFLQGPGTDTLIQLMESVEDNHKLISSATPLEVYAALRRRERSGELSPQSAAAAVEILRLETARMVQQPLNPAVLEAARQLIERTTLRWVEALHLGAAMVAREMFQGVEIVFVSSSEPLLAAAKAEGFPTFDPIKGPLPATATAADD